jgi:hypothetical protein
MERERKLKLFGRISKSGNPEISGFENYLEFFKKWPSKKYIIEVTILEPGKSESHIWYIIKMIVPAYVKGYKNQGRLITPEEALDIILECPVFYKSPNETYQIFNWEKQQPIDEMSTFELELAIEYLHFECLENFQIVIGNTKTI